MRNRNRELHASVTSEKYKQNFKVNRYTFLSISLPIQLHEHSSCVASYVTCDYKPCCRADIVSLLSVAFYEQTGLYTDDMKHHIYYIQISVPSSLLLWCKVAESDYCQYGEVGSLHENKHPIRLSTQKEKHYPE